METVQHTVGILADDLTSAADGAAPFVLRGSRGWIVRSDPFTKLEGDVLAVDSGSRSLSSEQAAQRAGRLASELAQSRIFFKTVDSTLRGNIKAELASAFPASGREQLVFAPAFPAAGRTTTNGVQYLNGTPVSDSIYSRDPVHPTQTSVIADLVPASIKDVKILDAVTQEELNEQVEAIQEPEHMFWVGSPGIAQALARSLLPDAAQGRRSNVVSGDILVTIGSSNPLSHSQADRIESETGVSLLRAPRDRVSDPRDVLVHIASAAASHVQSNATELLVATGGDTMEAILDHLNVRSFELLDELEPGFPLGRAFLNGGRQVLIAMKAGGFGDAETLRRAIASVRHETTVAKQVLS